jgi:hypothetical protein
LLISYSLIQPTPEKIPDLPHCRSYLRGIAAVALQVPQAGVDGVGEIA